MKKKTTTPPKVVWLDSQLVRKKYVTAFTCIAMGICTYAPFPLLDIDIGLLNDREIVEIKGCALKL